MVAALALWFAYAPVEVFGSVDCPAPGEVSRRLAETLPAAEEQPGRMPQLRAQLSRTQAGVHVDLQRADGERIAERDLGAQGSCEDLASAIAVVISAWEAELDPGIVARVDLPARPARSTPVVIASPGTPPPPNFEIGLALIASLTGGQLAPGARVEGWAAPRGWHLGLGVAVTGVTARSDSVGPLNGAARWTREALGAGPEARFDLRRATVNAHLQGLAALLQVEGVGLSTTASDTHGQLGVGSGVHAGWSWGHAAPWIGADVAFWPGHDVLEVGGLAARGALPRLELQLALGMSLGQFP